MSNEKEKLRQELIELDVKIQELEAKRDELEDKYYSMKGDATYE